MSATLKEIESRTLADGREWTRRELERRLQEEADRIAPVCPGSGLVLKRQNRAGVRHHDRGDAVSIAWHIDDTRLV